MIFLFAGTKHEADDYIRYHRFNPKRFCYLHSPEQLRGTRGATVWYLASYYRNKEVREILEMIHATEAIKQEAPE